MCVSVYMYVYAQEVTTIVLSEATGKSAINCNVIRIGMATFREGAAANELEKGNKSRKYCKRRLSEVFK